MRVKMIGSPGSGKTAALQALTLWLTGTVKKDSETFHRLRELGFSEEFLESVHGVYSFRDIIYITFQNSALEEFVVRRLGVSLDYHRRPGKNMRYFRTIHGLCATLLGDFDALPLAKSWLKPTLQFKKFASFYRKKYDPTFYFDEDAQGGSNYLYKGNQLWQTMTKIINTKYHELEDPNKIHDLINETLPPKLARAYRAWIAYKEKNMIIDYNDFLMLMHDALKSGVIDLSKPFWVRGNDDNYRYHLRVLIVDEAQDLTPLQWSIVKMIDDQMELSVYAGDDWQSIFGWSGARPEDFVTLPADIQIEMYKTHRLPKGINTISKYYAKNYLPPSNIYKPMIPIKNLKGTIRIIQFDRKKSSSVETLITEVVNDLRQGNTVMVLTRVNSQAVSIAKYFLLHRIRVRTLKRNIRWYDRVHPIGTFFDLMDSLILLSQAQASSTLHPQPEDVVRALWAMGEITQEKAEELLKSEGSLFKFLKPHWEKRLDLKLIQKHWGLAARNIVKDFMRKGSLPPIQLPRECTLWVDTIHSAKGSEADVVYLLNEVPKKQIRDEPDETRVWFVGLTRARKKLVLLHTQQGYPYVNNIVDLLRKYMKK